MTTPRILPSIDRLRQRPAIRALEMEYGRAAVLAALRGRQRNATTRADRPRGLPDQGQRPGGSIH